MNTAPPPEDPQPTTPAGREPQPSRAMHIAPSVSGPVEATAHTVMGIPVTAEPSTVAAEPVSAPATTAGPEPQPMTMDPGLLVTRDSPTGTPTRVAAPGGNPDPGEAATNAGRKAPARDEKQGLLTGVLFEGKYQIGQLLGEGGMGQVYRATHILMRKDVALKVLRPAMSVHPEIVERFRREAESAARLSHPHIISVLDFGRSVDGTFYLVMEFIVGRSLTSALREGPMHWRRVCRLGIQMLDALSEAHKAGVVHRDLKPDNIMLQVNAAGEESLKIVDFGIAKLLEGGTGPQLTQSGLVFGTPSYLSPEQAQGQPVTHQADLYAMGIIFYQMLTRQVPFKADSTMELLAKHVQEPPPCVRALVPEVPEVIEDLILRALAKKPGDRPADALEMRTVLARALEAEDLRAPAAPAAGDLLPPPPPPPPAARDLRVPVKAALGVLAVCAIGGLLYFAITRSSSDKPAEKSGATGPDQGLETPMKAGAEVPANGSSAAPKTMVQAPQDRTALDAALKAGDSARFGGKSPSIRKSIEALSGALTQDPELKKDPALHAHLNASLLGRNHWHRQLTLKLIREHFAGAAPGELKFLLVALNDEKFDTDHRHELYTFVKSRGLFEGIDEEGYATQQLRWGTSCQRRLEAALWFQKFGHRGHVDFLKAEVAKRSFRLSSGVTQSSDCYRPVLQEAVTAAGARAPGK